MAVDPDFRSEASHGVQDGVGEGHVEHVEAARRGAAVPVQVCQAVDARQGVQEHLVVIRGEDLSEDRERIIWSKRIQLLYLNIKFWQ